RHSDPAHHGRDQLACHPLSLARGHGHGRRHDRTRAPRGRLPGDPPRRVPRRAWGSMALAALGVALMLGGGLALGRLSGNLLALGSSVSFAGHALSLRFHRQTDMLPAVLYAGIFGTVFALLALGLEGLSPRVPPRDLVLALAMGVVQLGGGLVLYRRASGYLPAAELQLVATAELVLAPLWVWIGVGEAPGAATLVGGSLVIVAILIQAAGARAYFPGP